MWFSIRACNFLKIFKSFWIARPRDFPLKNGKLPPNSLLLLTLLESLGDWDIFIRKHISCELFNHLFFWSTIFIFIFWNIWFFCFLLNAFVIVLSIPSTLLPQKCFGFRYYCLACFVNCILFFLIFHTFCWLFLCGWKFYMIEPSLCMDTLRDNTSFLLDLYFILFFFNYVS
jgi:hypothetical protein